MHASLKIGDSVIMLNDEFPDWGVKGPQSIGGTPVTITVTEDIEGIKEKIEDLVASYNALKSYINDQTRFDAETEMAGILLGNYAAELVQSLLSNIVISTAPVPPAWLLIAPKRTSASNTSSWPAN